MYECSNCGGNLRFDIASQQLTCVHCNSQFDPYEITKERDAEESTDYEVTVFTCPQCAGEIYSTDNTAAGFCSFCGASTILDSRISKERRPGFIIPFKKTKEDCKKAYTKKIKKAIFAPDELRNPKHIESFRGIYMPYWVYHISQKGSILLKGEKEHRRGDYIITDHYDLTGNLDAYYKGLSYDASSSFADNISERLAPFDVKNMQSFTPSMLSGFYADTSDVDKGIYEHDAEIAAREQTGKFLKKQPDLREYSISNINYPAGDCRTTCENADLAMFPVWFLSYRNKDRVAYATVNGQTGKVVADMPVDIKKFLIGSLIVALPIFVLLNMFLTMRPPVLLNVVSIISMIAVILYRIELKQIMRKDRNLDDKGKLFGGKRSTGEQSQAQTAATLEEIKAMHRQRNNKKTNFIVRLMVLCCCIPLLTSVFMVLPFAFIGGGQWMLVLISLIVALIFTWQSVSDFKKIEKEKRIPGSVWSLIGMVLALLILLINPVHDAYYYIGIIGSAVALFFTLYDLIIYYNVLATRKLPQFDYKGGDDRA